jgi:hypothetical protein
VNASWRTVSSQPEEPSASVTWRSPTTSTRPKRTVRFASSPERSGPVTVTVVGDAGMRNAQRTGMGLGTVAATPATVALQRGLRGHVTLRVRRSALPVRATPVP